MDRKSIVINFSPFVLEQDIYCYIDGECKEHKKVGLDNLSNIVEILKQNYNINKISLVGFQDYVSRFKDELTNKTTFSNCEIEIISK